MGSNFGDLSFHFKSTDKWVRLADFDTDKNSELNAIELGTLRETLTNSEKAEFDQFIKEYDTNDDTKVTMEEVEQFEQKMAQEEEIENKMLELNDYIDSVLTGELAINVKKKLSAYKESCIKTYSGAISNMAATINNMLEIKKNELIDSAQSDLLSDKIKDAVAEVIERYLTNNNLSLNDDETEKLVSRMGTNLVRVAEAFVRAHIYEPINEVITMLKTYLTNHLTQDIQDNLQSDFTGWQTVADKSQDILPNEERINTLKQAAIKLINKCKSQGIQFAPDDIETMINNFTNMRDLKRLMSNIIDQINKSANTYADIYANGYEALVIRVDGTNAITNQPPITAKQAEQAMLEVLDDVISNATDLQAILEGHDSWRVELSETLKDAAKDFYKSGNFTDVETFKDNLKTYLEAMLDNPLVHLQELVNGVREGEGWNARLLAVDISHVDDQDLKDLKELLKDVWAAAEKANIQFVDPAGNKLTLKGIMDGYNKNNISELKDLISSLLTAITNFDMTLAEVYRTNGNGKIQLTLSGTQAAQQEKHLLWEDVKTTVEKRVDSLINDICTGDAAIAHSSELYQRFSKMAEAFFEKWISSTHEIPAGKTELECFSEELEALLSKYESPVGNSANELLDITDVIKKNSYLGCSDEEFAELSKALEDILAVANSYGFEFYNGDGTNKLNAKNILKNFNKDNASELKTLIMNIRNSIYGKLESFDGSYNKLYTEYPDGKMSIYIDGSDCDADFPIMMEDFEDDGISDIDPNEYWSDKDDARKYVKHRILDQLRREAKKMCQKYGVDYSDIAVNAPLDAAVHRGLDLYNPNGHESGMVYTHLVEVAKYAKKECMKSIADQIKNILGIKDTKPKVPKRDD